MKYSDLIKLTAAKTGVSQASTKTVIDSCMTVIKGALMSENEVVLNGVGKLVKKVRSARTGINPATKQKVTIPETKTVAFKAAKELKDIINK